MNLTIICKSAEVYSMFDGTVRVELIELDEDKLFERQIREFVDLLDEDALLDEIGEDAAKKYFDLVDEPEEKTIEELVSEFDANDLLNAIGKENAMEYFDLIEKE